MVRASLVTCTVLLLTASSAPAQGTTRQDDLRLATGLTVFDVAGQVAAPIGGFRANVDAAWGVGVAVRHHFSKLELLGVRGDFSFLNYGNERKRVPLSSTVNRVLVDMTTSNNIVVASAGPELMLTRGPINPYVYGFAGYSYFFTESSVGDDGDGGNFASSTNQGDGGLAKGWGGGVSVPLRVRQTLISIDAGARQTFNGPRTYLKPGDITDLSDGSLQINGRNTDADFWQYHVGVSFSFRRRT
jgi:hypothetical protein